MEKSRAESLAKLNTWMSEIRSWLGTNALKLNVNKTDILILASLRYLHMVTDNVVHVGDVSISSSQFVGVMFDQTLSIK